MAPDCKHRWLFPQANGATVRGVCRYCGDVQVCPTTTPTYGDRRNSGQVPAKDTGRTYDRSLARRG